MDSKSNTPYVVWVACVDSKEFPDEFRDLNDLNFRKVRENGIDVHSGVLIVMNPNLNPSAISIDTF